MVTQYGDQQHEIRYKHGISFMKRNAFETILGALVILGAIVFFQYSYKAGGMEQSEETYTVSAEFSGIGGLRAGDDVRISGVKVGTVQDVALNPITFLAQVTLLIDAGIELPLDTAALISSESLLGGLYLGLEPGSEEDYIEAGGQIEYTQAPQNLEQLLGQFIFSMQDKDSDDAAQ